MIQCSEQLPASLRESLAEEARCCTAARGRRDIAFFVDRLHPQDKWRILHEYLDDISIFDIETEGLTYDARITMIAVWHRGEVHNFVEHENLDDFLDLLDEVKLLVSYNGNSFDVPRVLDGFHIPKLPCPHLDLRWLGYHHGYQGGLKEFANKAGIERPTDLSDADGELAVRLWSRWVCYQDRDARDLLVRYCGSDVLLSLVLAYDLAGIRFPQDNQQLWSHLPPVSAVPRPHVMKPSVPIVGEFGEGSPARLRGRRIR